jgi:hypothetical protein
MAGISFVLVFIGARKSNLLIASKKAWVRSGQIITLIVLVINVTGGAGFLNAPVPATPTVTVTPLPSYTPTQVETLQATNTNTPISTNTLPPTVAPSATPTSTFTPTATFTVTPTETPTTPPTATNTPGYSTPTAIAKVTPYPGCGKSIIDEWMLARLKEMGYEPYDATKVTKPGSAGIGITVKYSIKMGTENTCIANVILTDGVLYSFSPHVYSGNYHDDYEFMAFTTGSPVNGKYAVQSKMHEDACNAGYLFEKRYTGVNAAFASGELPVSCFGITK